MSINSFPKDWPLLYRHPAPVYPNVWQKGPVSSASLPTSEGLSGLGCNCAGNSTVAQTTIGMGACPQTASVYVEDSSIPPIVWLIAAAWGLLMLVKKR